MMDDDQGPPQADSYLNLRVVSSKSKALVQMPYLSLKERVSWRAT